MKLFLLICVLFRYNNGVGDCAAVIGQVVELKVMKSRVLQWELNYVIECLWRDCVESRKLSVDRPDCFNQIETMLLQNSSLGF